MYEERVYVMYKALARQLARAQTLLTGVVQRRELHLARDVLIDSKLLQDVAARSSRQQDLC